MQLLRLDSTGTLVRELQKQLVEHGYPVAINGNFDQGTDAAVRQFQRDHNLKVDGIVGNKTWFNLYRSDHLNDALTMSDRGMDALIFDEGKRNRMYRDQAGLPTIGVGHLLTANELASGIIYIKGVPVRWKSGITDQQIDDLLDQDNDWAETAVKQRVKVPLKQHQFDALARFVFNIGEPAFTKSSALRELNNGNYHNVGPRMLVWNKVTRNGQREKSNGLMKRRMREVAMWEGRA